MALTRPRAAAKPARAGDAHRQPKAFARNSLVLGALIVAMIALVGCAKGTESAETQPRESFEVTFDRPLDANLIGIISGQATGVFEDAGLDLVIRFSNEPGGAIREVAAGRADLAVSEEPEVILARDGGLDVVAVAAVVDRPLSSLTWLPGAGIGQIADLRGESVAVAERPYLDAFLDAALSRADVPPDSVRRLRAPEGLSAALLSGRAEATLGGSPNIEGVELRQRNRQPRSVAVNEIGVPSYDEIVLVANAATLDQTEESIRLFIAALERGTEAASADSRAAARDLLESDPSLDPATALEQVEATLPLLRSTTPEQPFGWMDRERWQEFIAWMRDHELIGSLPDASEVLTNQYLPTGPPDNG